MIIHVPQRQSLSARQENLYYSETFLPNIYFYTEALGKQSNQS